MAKIQITGGGFQDSEGNVLANGYLEMVLSQDCQVASTAQICSGITVKVPLDANGNVLGTVNVWPNDQLLPANNFYTVTGYTSQGQRAWGPNVQQILGAGPFNLSTWVPNQLVVWVPTLTSLTLQTNEVNNGSQSKLDLHAGSNITLTDNGSGQVTIAASAPTGITLKTNGTPNGSQTTLNLAQGSNITLTDNGSGTVTIASPSPSGFIGSPDSARIQLAYPAAVGSSINSTGIGVNLPITTSSGAGITSTINSTNSPTATNAQFWQIGGTGTGVAGYAGIGTTGGGSTGVGIWGGRSFTFISRVSIATLFTNCNYMVGVSDSAWTSLNVGSSTMSTTGNYACFVLSPQASANWTVQACNGTANTKITTSVANDSTAHTMKIVYTPGVSAAFYIDGSLVGTITTNLPSTSTLFYMFAICNPYGSGTAAFNIESLYTSQSLT